MSLKGLVSAAGDDPALDQLLLCAQRPQPPQALDVLAPNAAIPLILGTLTSTGRTILAVTASEREADDLARALDSLVGPGTARVLPAWETLPHERLSPRADTVGRRIEILQQVAARDPQAPAVIVAPVRALLQPVVRDVTAREPLTLRAGDTIALDELVAYLVGAAYVRADLVERRGEFAVRGGIVDVFPPTAEHPIRVELWGDEVDELREFAVADQRSLAVVDALIAYPCRELLLTDAVRSRAAQLAALHPDLADILIPLSEGAPVDGMEALTPLLVDELSLVVDVLPEGAIVIACDPERIRSRAIDLVRTSEEFLAASWAGAAGGGAAPIDLGASAYRTLGDVRTHTLDAGTAWWTVGPFEADVADDGELLRVQALPLPRFAGVESAAAELGRFAADGARVVVVTQGHGSADRLMEVLTGSSVAATIVDDLAEAPAAGIVTVTTGMLLAGIRLTAAGLLIATEEDLTGTRSASRDLTKMPSRRRGGGLDAMALRAGDLVVHDQHGVGRFVEMTQRTVSGASREYLIVEYAKGDRLFVPTDQLDQLTRYVGGEQPSLDRLGGGDWAKRKGRARKAVREIAAELIRLYSARMASPGHAFGPDTPWQRELEDAFPYVETPDQLAAIDEVKADMESVVPMDRLICGDVGYGKTEIAVRAAFKAVQDGKQVAVLVPTTLLAQQHFQTFASRFAPFPVTVKMVSRFNTASEQAAVVAGVADGSVDVVIGTHRLLGSSTRFHDLGLVVIDEEQRFGVEHKEHLKALRTSVDVLAMSATPIPRTLEMAITGIREMSTILTPPEERHPVLTFVGAYDDRQVTAAVRRELLRDGQVFYIHNRVESITRAAAHLADLVPEARIAVAHGQMSEDDLERVMVDFWERRVDVLVCTTIVESGLDIANANTLIVERADLLGLSQLHQLRGRVGRGRERAYAYFLYPGERTMTEEAHDRLATIAANTDLGAGMAVAMKDLEIRGAGNLLGGEQSGHIAAVGFDMYVRMVGEAVADFKGQPPAETTDVKIELPLDAYLPHDYVSAERLRLDMYRRLAAAHDEAALDAVRAELVDRFGTLPEQVENLFEVARLRVAARQFGIFEIVATTSQVRFAPVTLTDSASVRLARLYPRSVVKAATSTVLIPRPTAVALGHPPLAGPELVRWCGEVLNRLHGAAE